jgi:hypothetical protein
MEGHAFLYLYLHKFLIYFHVFISKKMSFLNYILSGLFFLSTWPCLHPIEYFTFNILKMMIYKS